MGSKTGPFRSPPSCLDCLSVSLSLSLPLVSEPAATRMKLVRESLGLGQKRHLLLRQQRVDQSARSVKRAARTHGRPKRTDGPISAARGGRPGGHEEPHETSSSKAASSSSPRCHAFSDESSPGRDLAYWKVLHQNASRTAAIRSNDIDSARVHPHALQLRDLLHPRADRCERAESICDAVWEPVCGCQSGLGPTGEEKRGLAAARTAPTERLGRTPLEVRSADSPSPDSRRILSRRDALGRYRLG